ncbi:MAG TPA: CoA ester lyase [Myxococcaceae bacterium]|jgi:citrate lyase subunit beta/citryl-CoA lyase|nr:CoA ester lyase [Myxococcaceae bacterium]
MDPMTPLARSWLFVPATRPERFAKAAASGADRVIIDLEDAVAPESKVAARESLARAELPRTVPLYVRVNALSTEWFDADLAVAAGLSIAGIVLPKVGRGEEIARVASALAGEQSVVPFVETAAAMWNVLEIARAARVERLLFGAFDFQLDTGIRGDDGELATARFQIVVASRLAGLAPPIDSVSTQIADEAVVARDAERAMRFGFDGKLCIHPAQVPPTNRAFMPSAEEAEWAEGLMAELSSRTGSARGAFSYRGTMVDQPIIERARRILALAGRSAAERPAPR